LFLPMGQDQENKKSYFPSMHQGKYLHKCVGIFLFLLEMCRKKTTRQGIRK